VIIQPEPAERFRLLAAPDAVVVRAAASRAAVAQLRALPPATPVAVVGGRRAHRVARRGRVRITAEYLALPSLATPVAITEITGASLRWTARTVLTVPSGVTRPHALFWLAVRLVKAVPRLLVWAPAGERVVLGIRS
jgi:hypothetical protein